MSDWEPRYEFPDLSNAKYIGFDCETNDPNLQTLGPGAMRRDGFLVGVSVYADGFRNYYPLRHEAGGNMPRSQVIKWLKDIMETNVDKIGANIMYDMQWLWTEGILVGGKKHDVIIREALIDENQFSFSLDDIATRRGIIGKDETLLKRAAAERGWTKENQIKGNLWRLHSKYVGPYAEQDASLPVEVFHMQQPELDQFQLQTVVDLETRLTDTLFRMWLRGIPVDLNRADESIDKLRKLYEEALAKLKWEVGFDVDVWSGKSLQMAYEAKGLYYEKTPKGNPSFTADWLETQANFDPLSASILKARQFDRSGGVFIESKIVKSSVNGRIHPNYKQTKTEDGGGTKSGRLASVNPNLQQVPARNKELAAIIRSHFLSDTGKWGVFDYSQQEPRVGIHFAYLRGFAGAEAAVKEYTDNPATDYHQFVADMCQRIALVDVKRKDAKTINLGLAYGMGGAKLCRGLGLPTEEIEVRGRTIQIAGPQGQEILVAYDKAVPFVKELSKDAMNLASRRGYVKTILGRRCNFPDKRFAYRAANRIIQGSSADMIKKALIDLDDAGYLPYNTVHDEVDNPIESLDDCVKIRDIMLSSIKLVLPLKVDVEVGTTWGNVEEIDLCG